MSEPVYIIARLRQERDALMVENRTLRNIIVGLTEELMARDDDESLARDDGRCDCPVATFVNGRCLVCGGAGDQETTESAR